MAFTATEDTFRKFNAPNMESTVFSTMYGSHYSETINSKWTHPNPFVLQIGNHLFHKDQIPSNLRFNDQKRDKEALDNVRNRVFRTLTSDYAPSYARQAVPPTPAGSFVPYNLTNKTAHTAQTSQTVAYSYTTPYLPSTAVSATKTNEGPALTPAPLFHPTVGKPYSPLALPYTPPGVFGAYNYGNGGANTLCGGTNGLYSQYSSPYGGYGGLYGGYGGLNGGYPSTGYGIGGLSGYPSTLSGYPSTVVGPSFAPAPAATPASSS